MTQPAHGDAQAPETSDAELARRIAAGPDRAAEGELCRRFLPRVRLFGRRHLRDPEAADDLAQHVMTLTLSKLREGAVARPESIGSFTLGVARNAARDLGRAEARWRARAALDAVEEPTHEVPEEPLDLERLERCLAGLAERERSVLLLTFYDGESAPRIGERLGLTGGNVRVVRLRALERLRDCLGTVGEAAG